ncbi:MAG: tRNA (guanosine(37)-N1)-methyltransferase TrmD [Gammaproteobacteria bacterium]|nr:tRNA (guanosine(37)-N1)-methyltransferase TrmD [Gammaproteobacteria bacterium]
MRFDVLTLFPNMVSSILEDSILKRAIAGGLIEVNLHDFREFSKLKHHNVDDSPYGGGAGMVLMCEPIYDCLKSIEGNEDALKILLTPQGKTYTQKVAKELSLKNHIILICGHYEGFDERIRTFVDLELSVGDFVLTGGEIPAMAIIDSVSRLIPGVLHNEESAPTDSFENNLLEFPQYTKPYDFMGLKVPDVLLSGNHKEIEKFRKEEALKRTKERRPDLLDK